MGAALGPRTPWLVDRPSSGEFLGLEGPARNRTGQVDEPRGVASPCVERAPFTPCSESEAVHRNAMLIPRDEARVWKNRDEGGPRNGVLRRRGDQPLETMPRRSEPFDRHTVRGIKALGGVLIVTPSPVTSSAAAAA